MHAARTKTSIRTRTTRRREPEHTRAFASSAQVAELADELIVFQGETRHLLTAILAVVGLTALIVVVVGVLRFLR